jgi:hypothetical protein
MLDFQGVGSTGAPPTSLSRWDSLTQLLRRYALTVRRIIRCWRPRNQVASVSFHARRIDPRYPLTEASDHPVLKASSWRVSVLIQTERRIDRRCTHWDRWIIRCYCLHCSSSATRPTLLGNGPSVHPTVPRVPPVYQLIRRLHRRLLLRYCWFIGQCLFFSFLARFWPLIFLFWHVVFLHPWDI